MTTSLKDFIESEEVQSLIQDGKLLRLFYLASVNLVLEDLYNFIHDQNLDSMVYNELHVVPYSFFAHTDITTYNVPESVNGIAERAFKGCTKLTTIALPDTLKYIGEAAFMDCSSLTHIDIPSSIENINEATFSDTGLTEIHLSANVDVIDDFAFQNCEHLKIVEIMNPDPLSISSNAFSGCASIESITIAETMKDKMTRIFPDVVLSDIHVNYI